MLCVLFYESRFPLICDGSVYPCLRASREMKRRRAEQSRAHNELDDLESVTSDEEDVACGLLGLDELASEQEEREELVPRAMLVRNAIILAWMNGRTFHLERLAGALLRLKRHERSSVKVRRWVCCSQLRSLDNGVLTQLGQRAGQ